MLQQKPNEKRKRTAPPKGQREESPRRRQFDPLREIELPRIGVGAGDIWDPSSLLVFFSR
jgi:hypothetical protein